MMDAPLPLAIQAVVRGQDEHEAFVSGFRQAAIWLERAGCPAPKIALTVTPMLRTPNAGQPIALTLVSFIADAAANADFASMAASWRRQVADFTAATDTPLFLCTVFRHLGPATGRTDRGAGARLELIRRINLFIAELSQSTGAHVIDIDSVMAHLGGARLQSDFMLQGRLGVAAAGDVIASAVLNDGLEAHMPADALTRAAALHGGRRGIMQRLNAAIASGDARGAA